MTENTLNPTPVVEKRKPLMEIRVSTDYLTAYLHVKLTEEGQTVEPDDILMLLKDYGVTYGIRTEDIKQYCIEKKFYRELVCARGIAAVPGIDGEIQFLFERVAEKTPKEREDGTIDYRNLSLVQNVKQGDVLCTRTRPVPGTDGMDVYNRVIPQRQGIFPDFAAGQNTMVSADGLNLLAAIDGCVEYKNLQVQINDVYMIRGDVDSSTGNIDFVGSVVVTGDVRESFSIKAGGDLTVRGLVEGAALEVGGDAILSGGMNGMTIGKINAGGNVTGKYFENASIACGQDLYAEVLMHCRVNVQGSVKLKGKAALIGGKCEAGQKISARNIGAPSGSATSVTLNSPRLMTLFVGGAQEISQSILDRKAELESTLSKMESMAPPQADRMARFKLLRAKSAITAQLDEVNAQLDKEKQAQLEANEYQVLALHKAYPGVKLTIGPHTLTLNTEYDAMKFYADADGIKFMPVLPSDRV